MASRISIIPEQTELQLGPGESVGIVFTVTNAGPVVDAFQLSMQNVDPSWYTLSVDNLSLFPGDEAEVNVQVHPPAGGAALAGNHVFQLFATSIDSPTETATSTIMLSITAASELALELEPQRVVGSKGVFNLAVTNEGNVERAVVLRPSDPDERLAFAFGDAESVPIVKGGQRADPDAPTQAVDVATGTAVGETAMASRLPVDVTPPGADAPQGAVAMTIPPSSRVQVPITVAPKKRVWFGKVLNLNFEIAATPPGVEWEAHQARRVMGELVYTPIFSWWSKIPLVLRRLIPIIFALLLLGLLLYLLLRPTDQPPINTVDAGATQTALALSNSATQTALALAGGGDPNISATLTAIAAANAPSVAATLTAQAAANNGQGNLGPLRILKFDWATEGEDALAVTWEVTNALTVTLNTDVVPLLGTRPVDSSTDRSMTLTATNGKDTASRSLGVLLLRPPEIVVFKAEPAEVRAGEGVVVSWEVLRADEILLDGNPVSGPNGSVSLQPQQPEQHTLVARNNFGQAQSTVVINVIPPPPPPP